MPASSTNAVIDGEQPAKPPTRFTTNPPTGDAADGRALEAYRISSYVASYTAGISLSWGEDPEAAAARRSAALAAAGRHADLEA